MAGLDWVQVDVGFPMSLPVVCAARTLGMERRAFVGAMVELQIWAVQAGAPSVDVSTEAGRRWRECLAWLHDHGKRYALTWLAQARAVDVEDGRLVLEVPDAHFRQWVQEHYGQMVEQLARELGLEGVCWRVAEGIRAPLLG